MIGALDGIKKQILECIDSAYYKGYKNGLNDGNINDGTFAAKVKEAYNNGLNDAEKAIQLLCLGTYDGGLTFEEIKEVFDYVSMQYIVKTYTMAEIVNRIKEYEDRHKKTNDEIHVGDEINTFICHSCRWYDCTQKQCFDGHLQPKTECEGYIKDTSIPTQKEIQAETVKLMNLMIKAKVSREYIVFIDGSKIEVKISKEKSQND